MPPRRSHKKSRAGCKRCKARKIKCDEVHPRCGNCVKHGVPCDFEHPEIAEQLAQQAAANPYESPATPGALSAAETPRQPMASPAASSSNTPLYRAPGTSSARHGTSRMLELRLMHQYTSVTCKTLAVTAPITEEIWRRTVPLLAFSGAPYLTDALLAVAALHLRSLFPSDMELVRASHSYMASSLQQYCAALSKGINGTNAESLFLTSSLIAFQASASRRFLKEGETLVSGPGGYQVPVSYFHSFQGVKAVVASSWRWLRHSVIVVPIINSQPVLQLDFNASRHRTFFGHLLDGLEDEIVATTPAASSSRGAGMPDAMSTGMSTGMSSGLPMPGGPPLQDPPVMGDGNDAPSTRQAYQHAVAVLNWAHKIPHKGAALAFPATVSRRFVALLEERQPRALAILACYFALLKGLDQVWWLHGVARREVLAIASHFSGDEQWVRRLEWAIRIALYDGHVIPPDVWGTDWVQEDDALLQRSQAASSGMGPSGGVSFTNHIEMLSQMASTPLGASALSDMSRPEVTETLASTELGAEFGGWENLDFPMPQLDVQQDEEADPSLWAKDHIVADGEQEVNQCPTM